MIWSFSISERTVFLTFDDGPNPDITEYYLDRLNELGWKATFFCVGENVEKYPLLYERILQEGHAVGNHTHNHLSGFKTPHNVYLSNIQKAEKFIHSNLFRPPYGKMTKKQIKEVSKNYRIIMWSFMTYDFDINADTNALQKKLKQINSGDIIVQHGNEKYIENEKKVFELLVKNLLQNNFISKRID